jgi:hypothetical protein
MGNVSKLQRHNPAEKEVTKFHLKKEKQFQALTNSTNQEVHNVLKREQTTIANRRTHLSLSKCKKYLRDKRFTTIQMIIFIFLFIFANQKRK